MHKQKTKRLFIGIPVDTSARQFLRAAKDQIFPQLPSQQIRWVTESNYHLTLRFLGSMPIKQIGFIEQNLKHICKQHGAFNITLSSLKLFPSKNKPKIIASLVQPNERLENLVFSVNKNVDNFEVKKETRRYRGHITIARCRNPTGNKFEFSYDDQIYAMPVSEVALFESKSQPKGVVYTVLNRWRLNQQ